jgi:uncharacterized protein
MQQRLPRGRALWIVAAALLAATSAADEPPLAPVQPPTLALIVDDLGYSLAHGRRAIALPGPVTVAVLPFAPNTTTLAQIAAAAGTDVILHEPMQAAEETPSAPGTLTAAMSDADLRGQLQRALADVPQAIGVNNHTGSLLTAQRAPMLSLMDELRVRGLFFLDSRTTPDTVARDVAMEEGVPSARRDVFLDHVADIDDIAAEFERAVLIARRKGHAVLIAHPYDVSLAFLEQALPTLAARGVVQIRLAAMIDPAVRPAAAPVPSVARAFLRTAPDL